MSARSVNRRQYEEREGGSRTPLLVVIASVAFGLAALTLYIALSAPAQDTALGAVWNAMRGLGGSLFALLPLGLAWGGVLCVRAIRGGRVAPWRVALDLLLFMSLFSAVHVFFAERIIRERMTISGFSNFVSKSYGYGQGGGAIGALLTWPLFRFLGVAGGFIAALLIALLCLGLTGRLGRFYQWCAARVEDSRARRGEREEHMFETSARRASVEGPAPRDAGALRRPAEPPARGRGRQSAPSRDPFSESVLGGGLASDRPQRGTGRQAAARAGQGARRRKGDPAVDAFEAEIDSLTGGGASRARTAANARKARAAAPKPGATAQGAGVRAPEDRLSALGPVEQFDGLDLLDAQSILKDREEGAAKRRGFSPDRPSATRRAEAEARPGAEIPVVKADKKSNVKIEDLAIQPEAYELPDEDDEAPFDVEEAAPARKAYPKLRRVQAPEPEEDAPPEYYYPPIDLLAQGEAEDTSGQGQRDMQKAQLLEDTLHSFGISCKLIGIAHGPAVTRFELQPAPGVKVSRITSLADDIALNLAAMSVRIEAPIPGKAAVGVEIPNDKIEMVRLRDVLESGDARRHPSKIAVGLGKDNSGRYIVADIAKMPHVLIAGQTGSGKSVCINAIITSILFRASPEEVRLILIDPKVVELSIYNDIPHLVCPVVTDPKKAASALDWAVAEMTMRYKKFAERGVRDIKGYNKDLKPGEPMMPQMVIIIDELADLMMVAPGEVEDSICRLAQLARAAGMHLVIATQRPSVNVITGIIKANIPTRIAFSVASQVDSRTMIDHGGAEKLLGNGDMLFVPNGINKPMRVQGAWVSDDEVHAIVEYIKQTAETNYDPDMQEHLDNAVRTDAEKEEFAEEYDPKMPEAVDIVLEAGQASISMLQRRMRIGYARAGRLIDEMAQRGIVSEADGAKPRVVLISREEANAMFEE